MTKELKTQNQQGPDFDQDVATFCATGTLAVQRQGPDGHIDVLNYHADNTRVINGGWPDVERALKAGADIVASLRDRSIHISPKLAPTPGDPATFRCCAADSPVCQCPSINVLLPPMMPQPISADHLEISRNLQAAHCGDRLGRSTADDNFQHVLDNPLWNPRGEDTRWRTAGSIDVAMRAQTCEDCGSAPIATTLMGYDPSRLEMGPQWFVNAATVADPQTERSACWLEDDTGMLKPCSAAQHRYCLGVADPNFMPFGPSS